MLSASGDTTHPRADLINSLTPLFLCARCQQRMSCEQGEERNKIIALSVIQEGLMLPS